jgi:hypothetical protein
MSALEDRVLEDGDPTEDPTEAPTVSPTKQQQSGGDGGSYNGGGWLFFFVLCIVLSFVAWRMFVRWRRRREQRLLENRSAQANQVLGDMQMVPNEDLDDDFI